MDGNSIVEPTTVNDELCYAFTEFLERIGKRQGSGSELAGFFVNESVIR